MAKAKKLNKTAKVKPEKKIIKKSKGKEETNAPATEEEEEIEKEGGTLSDGVLDAFDEVSPEDSGGDEDLSDDDDFDVGEYSSDDDEW